MYPLFLERPEIRYRQVKGVNVFHGEPFYAEKIPAPLMKHRRGDVPGVMSGRRSGLTIVEGPDGKAIPIKLKGSGDLNHKVKTSRNHAGEPLGGQTETYAQNDLTATKLVGEIFREQAGIPNALVPIGLMHYDGFRFDGERCASSVYRAYGDTRIDELSALFASTLLENKEIKRPERFKSQISSLYEDIGKYCGSLVHFLYANDLIWGTRIYPDGDVLSNAHAGNFVLMPDGETRMRVGMVDFDAGSLADVIKRRDGWTRWLRNRDMYRITDHLHSQAEVDALNLLIRETEKTMAEGRIKDVPKDHIQIAELVNLQHTIPGFLRFSDRETGEQVTPEEWVKSFYRGFGWGLSSPDFRAIGFDYDRIVREAVQAAVPSDFRYNEFKDWLNDFRVGNVYGKKGKNDIYQRGNNGWPSYTGGPKGYRSLVDENYTNHSYFFGKKSKYGMFQ